MKYLKTLGWVVVVLIAFTAIVGYFQGVDYFVVPFQEKIRNRTFHESQAYNDGMALADPYRESLCG